jgi:thiol-disulfide isomerase/thioredoxin
MRHPWRLLGAVGVALVATLTFAQAEQNEASLRAEIQRLQVPAPAPSVPPQPEKSEEAEKWFKQIEPVLKPYYDREFQRSLALGDACQNLLKAFPNVSDVNSLTAEMIDAYLHTLPAGGARSEEARKRIEPLLQRPDLRAEAVLPVYFYQANMIAIMSGQGNLDELVPVTHDREEVAARLDQLADKFGARYPRSPELGQLSLAAAAFLDRSSGSNAAAQRDKLLKQADEFGSDDTKRRVAQLRFRDHAVGAECPPIAFTALDGRKVDLKSLRGKVVLVDFWATWCVPCVWKIPEVKELYQKEHHRGLEVIGISLDREREKLTEFVKKNELAWPQYYDGKDWQNEISDRFGVQAIPQLWLVDRKGNVAAIDPTDLKDQLEKLLAAAK